MTPEQQRIKIAEACGLENIHEEVHPAITYLWCGYAPERKIVPDYPSDLNAMHSAEKVLTDEQRRFYFAILYDVVENGESVFATASQKAEALLRTLNLFTIDAPKDQA